MKTGFMLNKKGFSLIETLMAIVLLGLFVIPIGAVFITSAKLNVYSRTNTEAYAIANKVLEDDMVGGAIEQTNDDGFVLTDAEYTKFGIDKTKFQVKKAIKIVPAVTNMPMQIDVVGGDAFAYTKDVNGLTIDLNQAGQIKYGENIANNNAFKFKIEDYNSEDKITVAKMNSGVVAGYLPELTGQFDYFCVILNYTPTVNNTPDLELTFENACGNNTMKNLYVINMALNNPVIKINTISNKLSSWRTYEAKKDKFTVGYDVSVAQVTVYVKHLQTGAVQSMAKQKPAYKFSS